MADPQHIVERIRAFMASTDEARTPELQEVAENYSAMCREANARLRRCRDYLRRGLRAEAIHEAEEAPPLLAFAALLDIPEAQQWAHACNIYQLTRPPPLLTDAARELKKAYPADQPLRPLLDRHRRLALQRAPLVQRLAVLRELAEADAATPFWVEDVTAFETVRLRELGVEASAAARAGDRAAVARLREEIYGGGWRAPLPADLQQLLDQTDAAWRREDGERELRQILPELDAAWGAMDFDAATRLLRQVKHLVDESMLEVPDDLVARIKPVGDWVSGERQRRERLARFEAACAQLSLAIVADAPEFELERLRREALGIGGELPADLAQKLRRISDQRAAARTGRVRRRRLVMGGTVLGIVVAAALVVRASIRDGHARDAYRSLSALVGSEKWDEAAKAWEHLDEAAPGASERTDFKELRARIDDALAQEQRRHGAFEAQMKATIASGPRSPDMNALGQAESLAKTAKERLAVSEFRSKIDAAREDVRRQQVESARQGLASLAGDVDSLEQQAKAGKVGAGDPKLVAAESNVGKLVGSDALPAELKQDAGALQRRLKALRERLSRTTLERDAMDAVVRGSASPAALHDALLAYAQQLPDMPQAAAFRQAAADAPAWEAVEEGAKFIESWEGKPQPPLSLVPARVQALAVYAGKYPESPFGRSFDDLRSYLMQEQRALTADGPWKGELTMLLASPILKEFKSIRTVDGKVYYLLPDATPQTDSLGLGFNAVLSGDTSTTKRITLKQAQIAGGLTESPQALLVADLNKKLAQLGEANWETFGLDVIDTILSHTDVDPVLRIILLSRCAKMAEAGTWGAGDAIKALDATTSALNAGDIAWMNPNDVAANQARERAKGILEPLSPLKEIRAIVTDKRDAMFKLLRLKIVGHAVLLREADGWTASTPSKPVPGQQAWVVATENGHKVLERIGRTTDEGRIAIAPEAVHGVAEGAMVFIVSGP